MNGRKMALIALCSAFVLTGCANKQSMEPMSRSEWNIETKRIYSNVTEEDVLSAAESMFELWDGEDFSFSYADSELSATRNWSIFAVVANVSGVDYWKVKTKVLNDDRVEVRVALSIGTSQSTMVIGAPAPFFGPPDSASTNIDTPYIYQLFWHRMDYLLGLEDAWYSCEDWKALNGFDQAALSTPCNPTAKDSSPIGS